MNAERLFRFPGHLAISQRRPPDRRHLAEQLSRASQLSKELPIQPVALLPEPPILI